MVNRREIFRIVPFDIFDFNPFFGEVLGGIVQETPCNCCNPPVQHTLVEVRDIRTGTIRTVYPRNILPT